MPFFNTAVAKGMHWNIICYSRHKSHDVHTRYGVISDFPNEQHNVYPKHWNWRFFLVRFHLDLDLQFDLHLGRVSNQIISDTTYNQTLVSREWKEL